MLDMLPWYDMQTRFSARVYSTQTAPLSAVNENDTVKANKLGYCALKNGI